MADQSRAGEFDTASGLPPHEKITMTVEEFEDLIRAAAHEAATGAIEGLRALPVATRMEAMGMTKYGVIDDSDQGLVYPQIEAWASDVPVFMEAKWTD